MNINLVKEFEVRFKTEPPCGDLLWSLTLSNTHYSLPHEINKYTNAIYYKNKIQSSVQQAVRDISKEIAATSYFEGEFMEDVFINEIKLHITQSFNDQQLNLRYTTKTRRSDDELIEWVEKMLSICPIR